MKCDISTQTVESSFNEAPQQPLKQATPVNTNIIIDWLKANASVLFNSRAHFGDTRYVYARESDVNASFRAYKRLINDKSVKSVKDTLVALGFQYLKTSLYVKGKGTTYGVRMYRVEADRFNDVIAHL